MNADNVLNTSTTSSAGRRFGSVIPQNTCQRLAPSTSAAS